MPRRVQSVSTATTTVLALLVSATAGASQQTPQEYRAHDVERYEAHTLDGSAAPARSLDGVYDLTSVSGQTLPLTTPSSYGTLRGATLEIRGQRYSIVYRYGADRELRIDGAVAFDRAAGQLVFRPTTAGIASATGSYSSGQIVSVVDGGFGIRNARFVFSLRGPSSDGPAPVTPPAGRTASPSPESPETAACPAPGAGNLVEPLSNGLQLSWTRDRIRERFGPGQTSWDARTITYPAFRVAVGGADLKIWHLHLTGPGACLNAGIGYGSSRADVQRAFGTSYGTTYGQYKLTFSYDGDRLVDVGVDPAAGEFAPFKPGAAPAPGASPKPAPSPTPAPKPQGGSILGKWWGVQSMTQIDVNADGTYTSPNGGRGTWSMSGDEIVFTGALAGWNHGHAKLTKGGWIEFNWRDASGAAYLFQLIRR